MSSSKVLPLPKVEDVVVEVTKLVSTSIDNYYKALSILGYKAQADVDALLIYSFFEEILTGPMRVFITESDYLAIIKAINCLQGSCLIPYKSYQGSNMFGEITFTPPRITEDSNVRVTEDNLVRFKS